MKTWTLRLADPHISGLLAALTIGTLVVVGLGPAIGPFLTALVVAYLLEGLIRPLTRIRVPRILAVFVVFSLFILLLLLFFLVLMPTLAQQISQLIDEVPRINRTLQEILVRFSAYAAGLVNPAMVENLLLRLVEASQNLLASTVTYLLHGLPGLFSILIYLFLVPFLVFFFLKDKEAMLVAVQRFLPRNRTLLIRVMRDVDAGTGGYIRGKVWETLLLGLVTYIVFALMNFQYAMLLAILTGLSALIPFLGVMVVIIPVAVLGVVQWGLTFEAVKPLIAYSILQLVDGNIVAPLILGEAVKIHPVTIILAVLVFGYLAGLLGVFFAVPLAILVRSVFEVLRNPDPRTGP
ncbi:MAG: AI-2E family transporter [Magnetococcales bacterium]|nr:AI-2E family transporter [Magnetococcales bacterium]